MRVFAGYSCRQDEVGLRFAGQRKSMPPKRQSEINAKLGDYQQEWQALARWDRATHPTPVLKQIRLNQLAASAKAFLTRQGLAHHSDATPFIIGISGSPASGKTTATGYWFKNLNQSAAKQFGWRLKKHGEAVSTVELDKYYRDFSKRRKALGDATFLEKTDLDHPRQVLLGSARQDIFRLKNGKAVRTPELSFVDSKRHVSQKLTVPAPFVLVEGLFAFVPKPLRELMDLKVFFSADAKTIDERWWKRAPERGLQRDKAGISMFRRAVAGYRQHTQPTQAHADLIVNSAAPLRDVNDTLRAVSRLLVQTFYPVRHP
jgi:uridine kinase